LVEEETLPGYKAERYYPVRKDELFQERYRVIGKLGYGSASTVWLCHDLHHDNAYVALKVYINASKVHRELPIYEHINSVTCRPKGSSHAQLPGSTSRNYVRKMLDSFDLSGPHGTHICLVLEALGMNFEEVRALSPGGRFEAALIRETFRCILRAIHFLHVEAQVIHTGQCWTARPSPLDTC
jgi:serine/threonine protein kinase